MLMPGISAGIIGIACEPLASFIVDEGIMNFIIILLNKSDSTEEYDDDGLFSEGAASVLYAT